VEINNDAALDPLERVRNGLRAYIRFGLENPNHYAITFVEGSFQCPAGGKCFGELLKGVGFAMEAGRMNGGDVVEVSQALWAGSHGLTALLITCP
jgi:hypothetical protein